MLSYGLLCRCDTDVRDLGSEFGLVYARQDDVRRRRLHVRRVHCVRHVVRQRGHLQQYRNRSCLNN